MYCKRCEYNLKGLAADRCPECGTHFDKDDASTYLESLWEYRYKKNLRRAVIMSITSTAATFAFIAILPAQSSPSLYGQLRNMGGLVLICLTFACYVYLNVAYFFVISAKGRPVVHPAASLCLFIVDMFIIVVIVGFLYFLFA